MTTFSRIFFADYCFFLISSPLQKRNILSPGTNLLLLKLNILQSHSFRVFFHYKVSIPQQKSVCGLRVRIVCSRYTPRKACEYLKKCYEEFTEAFITFFGVWGHSFSTHTKFSEKVPFCTPRYAHVRVRIRGYEMVVFRKILCMYYTNDPYCKVARQKVGPAFLQY